MLPKGFLDSLLRELDFHAVRSSGPGGQNVNKVNSKIEIRWNIGETSLLPFDVLQRLRIKYSNRINKDDQFYLSSGKYRDQLRNREDVLLRLQAMLESVFVAPKKRKKSKIPKGVNENRLKKKKLDSQKKSARGRGKGAFHDN